MKPVSNEKIKVTYLTLQLEMGGTERHLLELIKGLNKDEFDVSVITLMDGGAWKDIFVDTDVPIKSLNSSGMRFGMQFGNRISWHNIQSLFFAFPRLVGLLKEERPHILHAYLPLAYLLGFFASRLARIPHFLISKRYLGNYLEDKFLFQLIERFINRHTEWIIVNSDAIRRNLLSRVALNPDRIRLIYNGIDLAKFQPEIDLEKKKRELGLPLDAPIVGIIANLIPYKGQRDFLAAASLVLKEFPEVKFLIVGRDDGLGRELKDLTQELQIESAVVFTGPRLDIEEVYPVLDIQVCASHEEGFSNTILEGMAAGKPLVVTDVGGNPEAVIDQVTGIVIPPKNPEQMARAILSLLQDRDKARAMGQQGKKRVRELFTNQRMIQSLEALYREIVYAPYLVNKEWQNRKASR